MPFGVTLYESFILSVDEQAFARRNSRFSFGDDIPHAAHAGKSDIRMSMEFQLYLALKQIYCDGKSDMFITAGVCPFVSLRQFPYTSQAKTGDFDSVWVDRLPVDDTITPGMIRTHHTARSSEEQARKDFIVDRELQRSSFVALSWIDSCVQKNSTDIAIRLIKNAAQTFRVVAGRIRDAVTRLAGLANIRVIPVDTSALMPSPTFVCDWEQCKLEVTRVFSFLVTNKHTAETDGESGIILSITGLWRAPFHYDVRETEETVRLSGVIGHLVAGQTAFALDQSMTVVYALMGAALCLENATRWADAIIAP
jgi:hypothetical protein